MDRFTTAVLTMIALLFATGVYLDHTFGIRKHPPHVGHYEHISIWGEDYLEAIDSRPPAYAVLYVPVRSY